MQNKKLGVQSKLKMDKCTIFQVPAHCALCTMRISASEKCINKNDETQNIG